MFFVDLLTKAFKITLTKRALLDIFFICLYATLWFFTSEFIIMMDKIGWGKIHISVLDASLSIHGVMHHVIYALVLILITKRVVKLCDTVIFALIPGRARKRYLAIKITNFFIYVIAILLVLDMVAINTKLIATFLGAIGLGLSFGLQKIAANFISGIVLFAEQSVRLYDIVELSDGTVGMVKQIAPRYVLLGTSDGKDVFIPNEIFVTSSIINWTHSNNVCRDDFVITISHDSNVQKAVDIILDQIKKCPFAPDDKGSACYVKGYNELGINIEAQVWIDDVREHRNHVRSFILSGVINEFKKNKIKMPHSTYYNLT